MEVAIMSPRERWERDKQFATILSDRTTVAKFYRESSQFENEFMTMYTVIKWLKIL